MADSRTSRALPGRGVQGGIKEDDLRDSFNGDALSLVRKIQTGRGQTVESETRGINLVDRHQFGNHGLGQSLCREKDRGPGRSLERGSVDFDQESILFFFNQNRL